MEIVSVKFKEDILKTMDKAIKRHNFNSRTEFIRESVRKQLAELDSDELAKEFVKRFYGKAKKKTPLWMDRKIKEEVSKELEAELEKKFKKRPRA